MPNATPEDHPRRSIYLHNLGLRLSDRLRRTGAIADLEEAIQLGPEALNDVPDRASTLDCLGLLLGERFLRKGAIANIKEAIGVVLGSPENVDRDCHCDFLEHPCSRKPVTSIKCRHQSPLRVLGRREVSPRRGNPPDPIACLLSFVVRISSL